MKDVKKFADSILSELSGRMNGKFSKVKITKELVTLEGLLKGNPNTKQSKTSNASQTLNLSEKKKNIITQKDMEKLGNVEEITINKGDIVTPLAMDLLKKKKIKLIIKQ